MCAIFYLCVHLTSTQSELRKDGERNIRWEEEDMKMLRGDNGFGHWINHVCLYWVSCEPRFPNWVIPQEGRAASELQLVPVLAPEDEFQHPDPHGGHHCVLFLTRLLAEGCRVSFSFFLIRHLLILSRSRETSCGTSLQACQMLM